MKFYAIEMDLISSDKRWIIKQDNENVNRFSLCLKIIIELHSLLIVVKLIICYMRIPVSNNDRNVVAYTVKFECRNSRSRSMDIVAMAAVLKQKPYSFLTLYTEESCIFFNVLF